MCKYILETCTNISWENIFEMCANIFLKYVQIHFWNLSNCIFEPSEFFLKHVQIYCWHMCKYIFKTCGNICVFETCVGSKWTRGYRTCLKRSSPTGQRQKTHWSPPSRPTSISSRSSWPHSNNFTLSLDNIIDEGMFKHCQHVTGIFLIFTCVINIRESPPMAHHPCKLRTLIIKDCQFKGGVGPPYRMVCGSFLVNTTQCWGT